MELLAPAGNIRTFHAAVGAGADAVYLGLGDFNARMRAENFTAKTLSHLVPYAHSRRVKVYAALNTMVKQGEFGPLADTLYQLSQIGVDALIAADIGVIRVARRHFPGLALHASTQMFMHNSDCVSLARRLGMRRVILPRELTIEEITAIKKHTDIELEVFAHGALCYSFSGVCLASSFLGGGSGNRGRCTQACRRKFDCAGAQLQEGGFFFSPNDLSAISHIAGLRDAGVTSLKIEGRMRSAEYVHTVVSAYRRVIDAPGEVRSIADTLKYDMGRRKTAFFLGGVNQGGVIAGNAFSGTGVFIGTVMEIGPQEMTLPDRTPLETGDQIRIQPQSGFEGVSCKIRHAVVTDAGVRIGIDAATGFSAGDAVYLTSRKSLRDAIREPASLSVAPAPFKQSCPFAFKITGDRTPRRPGAKREELIIKIDRMEWLPLLADAGNDGVLAALDLDSWHALLKDKKTLSRRRDRLICTLPVFIPQKDLGKWHGVVDQLAHAGIARFACSHAGLRPFFPKSARIMADTFIWCLNRHTQEALHELGFSEFAYSLEDDFPNMRSQASPHGHAYVYSQIPLFISRIKPGIGPGAALTDPHDNRFLTASRNSLHYLLAESPMCLFNKIDKLKESGISNFIIDLSFMEPDAAVLDEILNAFHGRKKIEGSSQFNFKLGLR